MITLQRGTVYIENRKIHNILKTRKVEKIISKGNNLLRASNK